MQCSALCETNFGRRRVVDSYCELYVCYSREKSATTLIIIHRRIGLSKSEARRRWIAEWLNNNNNKVLVMQGLLLQSVSKWNHRRRQGRANSGQRQQLQQLPRPWRPLWAPCWHRRVSSRPGAPGPLSTRAASKCPRHVRSSRHAIVSPPWPHSRAALRSIYCPTLISSVLIHSSLLLLFFL